MTLGVCLESGQIRRFPDHDGSDDTGNGKFLGNVHGGTILKFLDEAAYACASRYSASYMVTVSVNLAEFRQSIHVGELVSFMARIDSVGRSSMSSAWRSLLRTRRPGSVGRPTTVITPWSPWKTASQKRFPLTPLK